MNNALQCVLSSIAAAPQDAPAYRRIADAIAAGIVRGGLSAGDRLPPQRTLANELGLALPTVSRGYRLALERGLITSTVGRGTFVAGIPDLRDERLLGRCDDMAVNAPVRGPQEGALRRSLKRLSEQPDLVAVLRYAPDIGGADHRRAAASWVGRRGLRVEPANVAITHGGQHALVTALAAVARPGDVVAVEELTYPGVRSAARLLGLTLVPVPMDGQGLRPEALQALCMSETPPSTLYTIPTGQNPTATTMPSERRESLAAVARRFDLAVVEDDVFGLLAQTDVHDVPPPLATFCPERTAYFTSFSKTISPGLRVGVLAGPREIMRRVGPIIRASVFNPSPLETAIAMSWIDDGTADRLVGWQRREAAKRAILTEIVLRQSPVVRLVRTSALHAWIELEGSWTSAEAAESASSAGVDIIPTPFFGAASGPTGAGVRLCLGNADGLQQLESVLRRLLAAWEQGPVGGPDTRV